MLIPNKKFREMLIMKILSLHGPKFDTKRMAMAAMLIALQIILEKLSIGDPAVLKIGLGFIATALIGFLLFNVYPAKVFMGDTGSLALGGFVAGAAYAMRLPMFILIIGLIYWVEIFSVMIQVTYFKKTGGKRFFKMAPIHHHFELCGWSETRIVAVFSTVTMLLCIVGLLLLR